jgi:DeoR/GlpR family transcriptional regulator of sugar metabolism
MLKEERQRHIIELLETDGRLVASDLAGKLKVSEDTIRRDLSDLARSGRIERVHGGALPRVAEPLDYRNRLNRDGEVKRAMAEAAAAFVEDGMVVFVDGGTTTLEFGRYLPSSLRATIVTSSLPLALSLMDRQGISVITLGGRLDRLSGCATGSSVLEAIGGIRADLAIVGLCAVHADEGLFSEDDEEARAKAAMLTASAYRVGLAVPSRLGAVAPFRIGPLSMIEALVTSSEGGGAALEGLTRLSERGDFCIVLANSPLSSRHTEVY